MAARIANNGDHDEQFDQLKPNYLGERRLRVSVVSFSHKKLNDLTKTKILVGGSK
jgi:hypothetical protein